MLNNRSAKGFVLKDFHYYKDKGNEWNNIARSCEKTMGFFHKQNMEKNSKLNSELGQEANSKRKKELEAAREEILARRISSSVQHTKRKTERFLIQEKSSQALDNKYEQKIDKQLKTLTEDDRHVMVLRKSGIKQTLASGGFSKNLWNDFSKLAEKQAKLNFADKIVKYDEEAARMIYERIKKEELDEKIKEQQKRENINKIREEKAFLKLTKASGAYTRPSTALTQPSYNRDSPESRLKSARCNEAHKLKELELMGRKNGSIVESSPFKSAREERSDSHWSNRLFSAKISTGRNPCPRNNEDFLSIPFEKYSDFNGLFVSKVNMLNVRTDTLPYSEALLKSSQMVRDTINSQIGSFSSRLKSSKNLFRKTIIDPKDKWPAPKPEARYSDINMNDRQVIFQEIEQFEQDFNPYELDRRIKHQKLFSPSQHYPLESPMKVSKDYKPLVYKKRALNQRLEKKESKSSKLDSLASKTEILAEESSNNL